MVYGLLPTPLLVDGFHLHYRARHLRHRVLFGCLFGMDAGQEESYREHRSSLHCLGKSSSNSRALRNQVEAQ